MPVKIIADLGGMGKGRWFLTNGATKVGPVELELIARGIEAGKVPLDSMIRHEAWKVWRPLTDVAVVTDTPARASKT